MHRLRLLVCLWLLAPNTLAVGQTLEIPRKGVLITSGGELSIVQSKPGQLTLKAVTGQKKHLIDWSLAGPGASFVEINHSQSDSTSTAVLSLKRPIPREWDGDSVVLVKAFLKGKPEKPKTTDSVVVKLLKFRRSGLTAPGSDPICVPLSRNEGPTGFSWRQRDASSGELAPRPLVAVEEKKGKNFVEKHVESDSKTYEILMRYYSTSDMGTAEYVLREEVGFYGALEIAAENLKSWLEPQNASMGIGAAVSAGIDNNPVLLRDSTAGVRYKGYPNKLTLGIGVEGSLESAVSGQIGMAVELPLTDQKRLHVTHRPEGTHVLKDKGPHNPGEPIVIQRLVSIASGLALEQVDDNEWSMHATASLGISFPRGERQFVELCFRPEI